MTASTEIYTNRVAYDDPAKRRAMTQIKTLLDGVLDARGKVLVKLNVAREHLEAVVAVLPSMKAPTVNELWGGDAYAVETVAPKNEINVLIPELIERGATDIIEMPISKIVP